MNKLLEIGEEFPRRLQLILLAAVLTFSGGIASAQSDEEESADVTADEEESADVTADDEDVVEEIITTGSRVVRDTYSSISPLQVIDGELARDLGLVDTADLLRQTTVVQGQQFTTGLSTSGGILTDSGPGSSTASLRGLDAGRTLVLVNGRRLAPAGVGGAPSAPDLNLVPGTLIERVDILLDGASSVYGSDAVAGVVNIMMRTDFDGLQLDWYRSSTGLENNGGDQQVISATWGVNDDTTAALLASPPNTPIPRGLRSVIWPNSTARMPASAEALILRELAVRYTMRAMALSGPVRPPPLPLASSALRMV